MKVKGIRSGTYLLKRVKDKSKSIIESALEHKIANKNHLLFCKEDKNALNMILLLF